MRRNSSNDVLWAMSRQVVIPNANSPRRVPRTASKTCLNSSIVDGSQDCLFAPISTTPLTLRFQQCPCESIDSRHSVSHHQILWRLRRHCSVGWGAVRSKCHPNPLANRVITSLGQFPR
jgi:hypothetical protein